MTDSTPPSLSRATARLLVAGIVLVALVLNLWELRADLPAVLHSDFVHAGQALDLLRTGRVEDRAVYPLPLVYAYAAADVLAYGVGRALGWSGYSDWPTFLRHLSQPQVHHAIGRGVGAVCAALLAVAVYRLARVRFNRSVAVLAAAVASFSPLQTIYAHQYRPHVPVVTLVVFMAPFVLRAALAPAPRAALLAGLGTGITSGVFQVGLPFAASAFALAALLVRPLRVLARTLALIGLGFLSGWIGLSLLATRTGLLAEGSRAGGLLLRGQGGSLGYGITDHFSQLGRFAQIGPLWLAAEAACALGFVGFLLLCLRGRRSGRDLLLYAVPAAAILFGIGLVYTARPRYTMYATPFLASLAASAALAIPAAPLGWLLARRLAVALLVLVPLLSSIRQDLLLGRSDTRIAIHEALPALTRTGLRVVVQADLLPAAVGVPGDVTLFPPNSDYRPWMRKAETPRQTLARLQPDVFVLSRATSNLTDADLAPFGLVPAFALGVEPAFVPDEPMWVLPELWQAERPGPVILCLARRELLERVRAALPR